MSALVTAVLSAGRPGNVPGMAGHCAGLRPVWLVPRGEEAAYRRAGAARVEGVPGGLPGARNRALDLAAEAGGWCVQLDDDLRAVRMLLPDKRVIRISLADAVHSIAGSMKETGARLGGVAPTANAYFCRRPLTDWGFVIGSLAVLVPGPERYDPELFLKQDWDMCLQHLHAYGRVARRDDILADFAHYSNGGGVVRYRTPELEGAMQQRMLARWPDLVRPHPRRANELAMKPRPKQQVA